MEWGHVCDIPEAARLMVEELVITLAKRLAEQKLVFRASTAKAVSVEMEQVD